MNSTTFIQHIEELAAEVRRYKTMESLDFSDVVVLSKKVAKFKKGISAEITKGIQITFVKKISFSYNKAVLITDRFYQKIGQFDSQIELRRIEIGTLEKHLLSVYDINKKEIPLHREYVVKKGETLEDVAEKLGTTIEGLRSYHNLYCDRDSMMGYEISSGKIILYPTEERKQEQKKKESEPKNVLLGKDFSLSFNPIHTYNEYGVMIKIEQEEKEAQNIKYETSVKWLSQDKEGNIVFEINRLSQLYINDEEANSIAEELASKTSKVFYPLQIKVNQIGDYIGLENHKDIVYRWVDVKRAILTEYEGETVEEYLELMENSIKEESNVYHSLKKDFFIRTLFNSFYISHSSDLIAENSISYPLFSDKEDLNFQVTQKIKPHLDEYNLVNIEQKGDLVEEDNAEELENKNALINGKEEGKYFAKYFLHPNSFIVESVLLECNIALEKPKKVSIVISNLAEKDISNVHQRQYSAILGEKDPETAKYRFLAD